MSSADPVSVPSNVPVFPLPGVVFFPHTILPLHIFESRYKAMIRDAMEGEKIIAVSLLKEGWERNYAGNPAFHDVGTTGRIEDLEPLADGQFNLRLVGLRRVRFQGLVKDRPYRLVQAAPLPETPVDESAPQILSAKLDLLASHGCLVRELMAPQGLGLVLDDRIPFEAAVNSACANLPVDPALRQGLLEEDDLLARHRRAAAVLDEVLKRVLRLKASRSRDEGGSDLN